ncbi:MAG: 2,3,4,5-tetrahydropyridine-2,6-dicarboxylate N-succinyltransferase [Kistimonas sp.]|nr:2,3,4,5-tetrahydropyridine-2,6-dicarboxylate N-succinyltransferase [Kistimonas sp.]
MDTEFFSLAAGVGTKSSNGEWLEVFYPAPFFQPDAWLVDALASVTGYQGGNQVIELDSTTCHALEEVFLQHNLLDHTLVLGALEASQNPRVLTFLATDAAPASTPEAYLKLHLISHRFVKPRSINLDGVFSLLPNVAWTCRGAIDPAELPHRQLAARSRGEVLRVYSIDRFPPMVNYVVPSGVRIADAARVRLGAYLGEGTTVMPAGFVNFDAGAEGPCMIEGRISSGVFVGAGSDLGGGCSTMGTLSGGGTARVSVGKNCLIGANAGVGIALGDRCTLEAGLYVTAGTKVSLLDDSGRVVDTVKASSLSGRSDLVFRRHSVTGAVECLPNRSSIALNESLHNN